MTAVDKDLIRQLVDGTISRDNARRLIRMERKDHERFFNYLEVLQERVPWTERILLRLSDHLYIVAKQGGGRVVKCDCGQEFGDYRANWKLTALINVRRTHEEFAEVYHPAPACPEPDWQEIREYYCPRCQAQLAVEIVPPGYPVVMEMLPDLDRFYREFLGRPLPDEAAEWYQDHTHRTTRRWLDAASPA